VNSGLARASKKARHHAIIAAFLAIGLSSAWAGPPLLFPVKTAMVAVDPGHGGSETGARGPTGLLEKNVCLELARKLAVRLESRYHVTLVRSDDYQVELQQRSAIANQAQADLLVSLHTGAGFVHSMQGISIYYHVPRNSPLSDRQTSGGKASPWQWDQTQLRHQPDSLSLATTLKQYLEQIPDAPACRIKGAPLPLLQGADMPAVLIEIGYLTHPATEAKLAAPREQELLCEQIFKGIQDFISRQK
jgi:N-acetylmuramoyl-L-alanine amidase